MRLPVLYAPQVCWEEGPHVAPPKSWPALGVGQAWSPVGTLPKGLVWMIASKENILIYMHSSLRPSEVYSYSWTSTKFSCMLGCRQYSLFLPRILNSWPSCLFVLRAGISSWVWMNFSRCCGMVTSLLEFAHSHTTVQSRKRTKKVWSRLISTWARVAGAALTWPEPYYPRPKRP